MADEPQKPEVIDPDCVPEVICDGQFNVSITGNLATLTFTHVRPDPTMMFSTARAKIRRARPRCNYPPEFGSPPGSIETGYPNPRHARATGRRSHPSLAYLPGGPSPDTSIGTFDLLPPVLASDGCSHASDG
jgi:hypothetical protein